MFCLQYLFFVFSQLYITQQNPIILIGLILSSCYRRIIEINFSDCLITTIFNMPVIFIFVCSFSRYPRKILKRMLIQKSFLQMNLAKMMSLKVTLMKKLKADLHCLEQTAVVCNHLLLNNLVCPLAVPLIVA